MHWLGDIKVAGPLHARHLINGSLAIGKVVNRAFHHQKGLRWAADGVESPVERLIQIK